MATLNVATRDPPEDGDVLHWTFHFIFSTANPHPSIVAEVIGSNPNFELSVRRGEDSKEWEGHHQSIEVLELDSLAAVKLALGIIEKQKVQNDVPHWMCQDWVLDCLETMCEEGVVGEWEYAEAKETLTAIYNE